MIVKTKILCYSTDLQEVGVDSDSWYDAALDMTKVIGVRLTAGKDGEPTQGEIKVYMQGGYDFIIQYDFEEFYQLWKKSDTINLLTKFQ